MKKLIILSLSLMMLLTLSSCVTGKDAASNETQLPYVEEVVSIDSSNGDYKISAVLTTPTATEEKVPLVVMLHGFGGNKDEGFGFIHIARTLAEHGIASIRMDFAGTGDDQRDFTLYTLDSAAADADDCLAYAIANADIDETKLGIFGYSNGGRIATLITGEAPEKYQVRVLLAPAVIADTESDKLALEACGDTGYMEMPWFGVTLRISKEYYESTIRFGENLAKYEKAIMPTLVIRGTEDQMVSDEIVNAYIDATGANKFSLYGSDHSYGFYSEDAASYTLMDTVANVTASFFAQHFAN